MSIHLTDDDVGKKFLTRDGRVVVLKKTDPGNIIVNTHPFYYGRGYTVSVDGRYRGSAANGFDITKRLQDSRPEQIQNVLRVLPNEAADRKAAPMASGALDYFPLAVAEVARISKAGNDQHSPGQPLHWARHKSGDHADCIVRHLVERGLIDNDGQRHTAKVAWRALALLQEELEQAAGWSPDLAV